MPYFTVDNLRLHYRERGDGDLLFVLPGNTASAACHDGELAHFANRFRTVAPDFRGTGRSMRMEVWPDDWYQRCAHDMAVLADQLGHREFVAMGTSGGAIVALWLAILYPERVRVVVADSTMPTFPPDWLRRGMAARGGRTSGQVQFWRGAHGDDWEQVVEADTAMMLRLAERGGNIFDDRLREIRCPVLVTASLGDTMLADVGPSMLTMLAQILDSRLFMVKQGDHPFMWSNAGEFRRMADAFLGAWLTKA